MILLDTKSIPFGSEFTLNQFKTILYVNYLTLKKNGSEGILVISRMFSDTQVKEAIDSIYLDRFRNIISDGHSNHDKILRYLEFGGEGVEALHLLSDSRKKILERRKANVQ